MTEMVPDSMNSGALRAHKHRLRTVRTAHVIVSTRRRPDTSIETAGRNATAENGMGVGERVW